MTFSRTTRELFFSKQPSTHSRIFASLILIMALSLMEGARAEDIVTWRKAGVDIDIGVSNIREGLLFPVEVVFVRSSLARYRIGIIRAKELGRKTSTAKEMCKQRQAVACINANFFDENNNPLGLVVQNGIRLQGAHTGGKTLTGIFYLTRKGPAISHRREVERLAILEGIQAGPRLLVNGRPLQFAAKSEDSSRRSGVCVDKEDRVVFFAVSAQFFGVPFSSLAPLLASDSVRCREALNLDGGGSTQLYVSRAVTGVVEGFQGVDIPGRDTVPVSLALLPGR